MLSKRVRLYLALVLALIAVTTTVNFAFASNSAADGQSGNSVNATAAATMAAPTLIANFPLCQPPTPTPAPTATKGAAPTKAATMAATAAMMPATMAATMAPMAMTMAATMAPTAAMMAATMAPTAAPVMPTATPIQIGKKPAEAGVRVAGTKNWLNKGAHCINVAEVTAGGPSDIAGIKSGDLVLGFDKDALKDPADFYAHVSKHLSGDVVTITVQRGGKAMSLKVTLGLNPFIQ